MQHLNYYTFSLLLPYLEAFYLNQQLASAWSQEKDTLVLYFPNSSYPYLLISCQPEFPFLLPVKSFHRKQTNVAHLFSAIHRVPFTEIELPPQQRCLLFHFQDHILLLKFFGVHSNILLFDVHHEHPTEIFRKRLKKDHELTLNSLFRAVNLPETIPSHQIRDYLPAIHPDWLHLFSQPTYSLSEITAVLHQQVLSPPYYLYEKEGKPYFSLIPLPNCALLFQSDSLLQCLHTFVFQFRSRRSLQEKKEALLLKLKEKRQHLLQSIKSRQKHLQFLSTTYQTWADLLLTHLPELSPGMDSVTVSDPSNSGQSITIPLKPELKPMENIQRYYQKAKEIKAQQKKTERLLKKEEEELEQIESLLSEVQAIQSHGEWIRITKKWKPFIEALTSSKDNPSNRFPSFVVEGYKIYYGRSAKENEDLIRHVARKGDWWFHVKGESGGHVIVKSPHGGKLPEKIKTIAGGIAAFLSKQKHQSLVLVQYTQVKYLRKGKGLPPGTFLIEREATLLVSPYSPPEE